MVINEEPVEARFGANPWGGVFPVCLACGNLVNMSGKGHGATCPFAGVAPGSESDREITDAQLREARELLKTTGRETVAGLREVAEYANDMCYFDQRRAEVEQRDKDARVFIASLCEVLVRSSNGVCYATDEEIPGVYAFVFVGPFATLPDDRPKRVVFTLWWDSGWEYKAVGPKKAFISLGATQDLPHLESCVKEILSVC